MNENLIVAKQGTVALGAGNAVTLDLNGDGLLNLAVDQAAVHASVVNHNFIQADGGQVIMTARASQALASTVVNNSGIIQAQGMDKVNGTIRLDGGTSGVVTNSGTLDASGKAAGQTGGTVKVLGETVNLDSGSKIDVSGANGGGTVLVGGNFHGTGSEQNATTTTVAAGTTINADAINQGNGGKVAVWSNDTTTFNGAISAKGGSQSGNGGSVETSGHQMLKVGDTASVTTLAANGKSGDWLLDPADFTIAASGGDMTGTQLDTMLGLGNVTIMTTSTTPTVNGTGYTGTAGNGDIFVNDAINWSNTNSLTLSAYHDIVTNAAITNSGTGGLTMTAHTGGITLNATSGSISLNGGSLAMTAGGDINALAPISLTGSGNLTMTAGGAITTGNGYGTTALTFADGNATLTANGGDVTINGLTKWTGAGTLTLSAYRDVNINQVQGAQAVYNADGTISVGTQSANGSSFDNTVATIIGNGGGNLVMRADNSGVGTGVLGAGHGMVNIFFTDYANNQYAIDLSNSDGSVAGSGNKITIYYDPADGFNSYWNFSSTDYVGTYTLPTTEVCTNSFADGTNPWMDTNGYSDIPHLKGNLTAYMLVNTLTDLNNIRNDPKGVYFLSHDIDASATKTWNSGAGWSPIYFTGCFDGGGNAIRNLYINNNDSTASTGLFSSINISDPFYDPANPVQVYFYQASDYTPLNYSSVVNNNGVVRNLGLDNVDITGSGMSVGGLAGVAFIESTIGNVYVTGKVSAANPTDGNSTIGGLIGQVSFREVYVPQYTGGISNCSSTADVTVTLSAAAMGTVYAGGLLGQATPETALSKSYSSGMVKVTDTGSQTRSFYLGGLVGDNEGGTIDQSSSSGPVTLNTSGTYGGTRAPNYYLGGLTGASNLGLHSDSGSGRQTLYPATISNSYSTSPVTFNNSRVASVNGSAYIGGLAGYNTGTVTGSYSASRLTNNGRSGDTSYLGGLIGYNDNTLTTVGKVTITANARSPTTTGTKIRPGRASGPTSPTPLRPPASPA
jgi:hypothetical protein